MRCVLMRFSDLGVRVAAASTHQMRIFSALYSEVARSLKVEQEMRIQIDLFVCKCSECTQRFRQVSD